MGSWFIEVLSLLTINYEPITILSVVQLKKFVKGDKLSKSFRQLQI